MMMMMLMMMMTRTWLDESNSIFLLGLQIFAQIWNHKNALINHHSDSTMLSVMVMVMVMITFLKKPFWNPWVEAPKWGSNHPRCLLLMIIDYHIDAIGCDYHGNAFHDDDHPQYLLVQYWYWLLHFDSVTAQAEMGQQIGKFVQLQSNRRNKLVLVKGF